MGHYQIPSIKMRHLRFLIKRTGEPKWWLTKKEDFLVLGKKRTGNKDLFDPYTRFLSRMTWEEKGYKLAKMTIKIKKGKSGKYYCPSIKMKQLRQLQKFISRKYWHVNNEDLLYLEGQKKYPDKTQYNQLLGYPEFLIKELMEAKAHIK